MLNFILNLFGVDGDDPKVRREYELTEEKTEGGLIVPSVSRRNFLFGLGATAILPVVPKVIYSFPSEFHFTQALACRFEKIRHLLPVLYERSDPISLFGLPMAMPDGMVNAAGAWNGLSRDERSWKDDQYFMFKENQTILYGSYGQIKAMAELTPASNSPEDLATADAALLLDTAVNF